MSLEISFLLIETSNGSENVFVELGVGVGSGTAGQGFLES